MKRGSTQDARIKREEADLEALLSLLPDNPVEWVSVVKLIAPLIARLAVRYALKKVKRTMSEEKVNAIGTAVGGLIRGIVGQNKGVGPPR